MIHFMVLPYKCTRRQEMRSAKKQRNIVKIDNLHNQKICIVKHQITQGLLAVQKPTNEKRIPVIE